MTQTAYDAVNRAVTVTYAGTEVAVRNYDQAGNLTLTIDPRNVETAYTYDALNRLSTVTDAYASGSLARTTTYTLDAVGNQVAITDPVGHAVTTSFDALNRPTLIQDAFGQVTSTTYDAGGAVSLVDDGLSYRTTYKLDALGRATRTIDANGNYTAQAFDADGRMVSSTDGMSDTSQTVYDAAGRVVQQIDPRRLSTFLSYDKTGRLTSVTDPVYNTTSDRYDQSGRLTQQTDQQGHSDTYLYDAGGRQTSHTDRDGRQDLYSYDADNRLTAVTWKDANGNTTDVQAYTYDPNGNVLTAGDNNGTYTYTYDILNRALTELEPFGVSLTFAYDAADKLTGMHDSFGGYTTYTFDAADRLAAVQFSTVNAQGQVSEPTRLNLGYDNRDALVGETRYQDVAGTQQVGNSNFYYDSAGRLTTITDTKAGGTITLDTFNYTYDKADRVTSETTSYTGATKTYAYDPDGQLKSDGTNTLTYDANGNRTSFGFSTPLASNNELASDLYWNYTYDNAGNLIQKTTSNGYTTFKYQYDNANRLTQAAEYQAPTGSVAVYKEVYKYDVYNNRIETDIYASGDNNPSPTTITRSAFDPWGNAFADFDTTLHGSARRLSLPALDAVFARFDGGGATWWNLTDRQGSVRDVMGNDQTIADHVEYTPFGRPSETPGKQGFADRYFNGLVWNYTTGLLHERDRDLNPDTARYNQQDPLGLSAGDTNLFRDVRNDPANLIDPSGDWPDWLDNVGRVAGNVALGFVSVPVEINNMTFDVAQAGLQAGSLFTNARGWTGVYQYTPSSALFRGMDEASRRGQGGEYMANAVLNVATMGGLGIYNAIQEGLETQNWSNFQQELGAAVWLVVPYIPRGLRGARAVGRRLAPVGRGLLGALRRATEGGPRNPCFPAGTSVAAEAGPIPIEEVRRGDRVWGFDLMAGKWRLAAVAATYVHDHEGEIVAFTAAGATVEATGNHPVWVVEGETLQERQPSEEAPDTPEGMVPGRWVQAGDLRVGDMVLLRSGKTAAVSRLAVRPVRLLVYNIEVEGVHTYAVGSAQVLVHNKTFPRTNVRPGTLLNPFADGPQNATRNFFGQGESVTPPVTPPPESVGPTVHYNRQLRYGGAQTNSPAGQAARAAAEGQLCPTCGEPMLSGTNTAPIPEHSPPLVQHYHQRGGWAMTDAERRAYARSGESINGAACQQCQRAQGAVMARFARLMAQWLGLQ
jgi:RHS repeat-associated protein